MLLTLVFLLAALQLLIWSVVLHPAYRDPPRGPLVENPADTVSVIVCFRNEAEQLEACVSRILAQAFPGKFELLLVDDNSTDNSASIVHPYVIKYENVRLLDPGPTRPGKKDALACGIAHARYDHLLLTDADCVPASSHWLWWMTEPLRRGKDLVLGASPLLPGKKTGWLGVWQWYESVYVSLKYLGFARRGKPFMGVGRNLAYTRAFYERAGGFTAHADLPGGDDDLLVAGNAEAARTATVCLPAAWTHSSGQPTWSDYFRQRARHQSTGSRYPRGTALRLGLLALSHGLFYLLGFALLFTGWWWVGVALYVMRLAVVYASFVPPLLYANAGGAAGAEAGIKSKVWLAGVVALGDALVAPMYLWLAVSGLTGSRKSW